MEFASAFGENAAIVQWSVVMCAATVAGISDCWTRQIPNLLTLPLIVLGYSISAMLGGLVGFVDAMAASLVLGLPYVLLFAFAGGGGGDAKIMAGLGAWLGLANGTVVLFAVSLVGAALALLFLVFCLIFERAATTVPDGAATPVRRRRIPYGVAVWGGVCLAAIGVMQCGW